MNISSFKSFQVDGTIIRQTLFHTENIHNSAIFISIEFTLNKLLFPCIENTIYRHEESELNGVGGKLICSGCNFLTTDEESLRNHIREEHSGHKFKCQKCDYSNESKYWVNNHFAIIHEGVRYPCDYCEFLSKSRGELTKHNRKFHG